MADGGLKIQLDAALAGKLRAFATATGSPIDSVVREAVTDYLDDWTETLGRLAEYDRTGISIDAGEALDRFEESVTVRARQRA